MAPSSVYSRGPNKSLSTPFTFAGHVVTQVKAMNAEHFRAVFLRHAVGEVPSAVVCSPVSIS